MNFERDMYQQKKDYVSGLSAFMSAHPDFKSIEYVTLYSHGEEFVKIDFITGPLVMNVTGDSIVAIAQEIAKLMVGIQIESVVTNIEKLRAIEKVVQQQSRLSSMPIIRHAKATVPEEVENVDPEEENETEEQAAAFGE